MIERTALLTPEITIHRDSITPLYRQVKEGLKSWIIEGLESGTLAAGDRVPSENELTNGLGVSQITIRRALDELRDEGYIQRIQGRGSFITGEKKLELSLTRLFSLTTLTLEQGMKPTRKMLEFEELSAAPSIARQLQIAIGAPVARLVRLILMDAIPVSVDTSYLPLSLFPGLLVEYREELSLYDLLNARYGNGPVRAHDVLEPVLTNEFEARVLQAPVGSPTILIQRTAYGRHGVPVEFTKSVFRGDMCRFSIDVGK